MPKPRSKIEVAPDGKQYEVREKTGDQFVEAASNSNMPGATFLTSRGVVMAKGLQARVALSVYDEVAGLSAVGQANFAVWDDEKPGHAPVFFVLQEFSAARVERALERATTLANSVLYFLCAEQTLDTLGLYLFGAEKWSGKVYQEQVQFALAEKESADVVH